MSLGNCKREGAYFVEPSKRGSCEDVAVPLNCEIEADVSRPGTRTSGIADGVSVFFFFLCFLFFRLTSDDQEQRS